MDTLLRYKWAIVVVAVLGGLGFLFLYRQPVVAPDFDNSSQEDVITNEEAIKLINACQVDATLETHAGVVSVTLKTGQSHKIANPDRQQIAEAVQAVDSRCQVKRLTE